MDSPVHYVKLPEGILIGEHETHNGFWVPFLENLGRAAELGFNGDITGDIYIYISSLPQV